MPTYLDSPTLAAALGVSTRGLAARCERLGITPLRIGHRTIRYSAAQVEAALAGLAGEPTPPAAMPVRLADLTGGRRR